MNWENAAKLLGPLLKAALILAIGHVLIVYLVRLLNRALRRTSLDQSLVRFLGRGANIVAHVLTVLSALTVVGVSTTGVVAALSALAVGVSVALKDSLGNVAGGILLLISPRFSTGDFIAADGDEGKVVDVDLLHTTIRTPDNRQVSIPNGALINSHIVNYSREPLRRVDLALPVACDADVERAKALALEVLGSHPLALREPDAPFVRVRSYEDGAANLALRVWCKTENYWPLYHDLLEQIAARLAENGIAIAPKRIEVQMKDR